MELQLDRVTKQYGTKRAVDRLNLSMKVGVYGLLGANGAYIEQVLEILNHTSHEGYYVKMAVAWAVSVCYVKFPIQTKRLLLANEMDDFTHNKAIQKIRESYRVSREEKVELNRLKR